MPSDKTAAIASSMLILRAAPIIYKLTVNSSFCSSSIVLMESLQQLLPAVHLTKRTLIDYIKMSRKRFRQELGKMDARHLRLEISAALQGEINCAEMRFTSRSEGLNIYLWVFFSSYLVGRQAPPLVPAGGCLWRAALLARKGHLKRTRVGVETASRHSNRKSPLFSELSVPSEELNNQPPHPPQTSRNRKRKHQIKKKFSHLCLETQKKC